MTDRRIEEIQTPWSWSEFSVSSEQRPVQITVPRRTNTKGRISRLEREGTLLAQLAKLTSANTFETSYLTHGIHPYPAKYIPQLPNLIIREHTNERSTVLDPFCGSGTTLLEAATLGRKSIGIDSHPIATLISRAKTTALQDGDLANAERFLTWVRGVNGAPRSTPLPNFGDLDVRHWFPEAVIRELEFLRTSIDAAPSKELKNFLRCIFSSIVVSVSFQESETRYAAIEKKLVEGDVFRRFGQKLARELPNIRALSQVANVARNQPDVRNADIREASKLGLRESSIDLVVTSPPYPNSFDYYLYHKWRMYWLGYDHKLVKAQEIGSRHEHSSQKKPIGSYVEKMRGALEQTALLLKPSKLAYFFVGDAILNGELINILETFKDITAGLDLRLVGETNYSLEDVTRSFHEKTSHGCHGGRRRPEKRQHVLVFERINRGRVVTGPDRTTASPQSVRKVTDLRAPIKNGATIALASKDSQRHIHSLGRYPSRFIPEVPRWAVSEYSRAGDVILDPFVGSGSTGVEALMLQRNFIGVDFSPYSCLLTQGKLSRIEPALLIRWTKKIERELNGRIPKIAVRRLRFPLDTFWFDSQYLTQIAKLRSYIEENVPEDLKTYFLSVLSTVIRPCSFQDEGQVKVKRDPKKVLHGTSSPFDLMQVALRKNLDRKLEFLDKASSSVSCSVMESSAENIWPGKIKSGKVDLVVTSPPYINAMNYPMTHRYENILLGLFEDQGKIEHEEGYFGSERVYAAEYKEPRLIEGLFPREKLLNKLLLEVFKHEPKRSYVAYRYFVKMFSTFESLREVLKPQGRIVLVAGRNTIRGTPIDTFGYLCAMLEALDFRCDRHFNYEIIKNAFKLTRHPTADIIKTDGVGVFTKNR